MVVCCYIWLGDGPGICPRWNLAFDKDCGNGLLVLQQRYTESKGLKTRQNEFEDSLPEGCQRGQLTPERFRGNPFDYTLGTSL